MAARSAPLYIGPTHRKMVAVHRMVPTGIRFPNFYLRNVSGPRGEHCLGSKREQVPFSGRHTPSLPLTTEVNVIYVFRLQGETVSSFDGCHSDPSISHSASFCSRFTTLDNPIQNFFNSLPHPATSSRSPRTGGAYASQQMFLVVNLAALSQITLRCPLALLHVPSNKVCVETAVRAVRALNGIENPKIMNPIRVTSWGVFFFTLQGELGRLRSRPWQGNGFASTGRGPNEVREIDISSGSLASFSGS